MDRSKAARAMGQAKSQAKTDAARLNAKKGGWPKGRRRIVWSRAWDWNDVQIRESAKGWIVEISARVTGAYSGGRTLIPYGAFGIERGVDLDAPWNESMSLGDRLSTEPEAHGRILRRGHLVR